MPAKTIKFKGATYVLAAETKSFLDYEMEGQKLFLLDVAKKVREVAGGHAENVEVKRGRSVVWLEYEGQDLGDMDLYWRVSLVTDAEPNTVILLWEVNSAVRGRNNGEAPYRLGELTVDRVISYFHNAFGKR